MIAQSARPKQKTKPKKRKTEQVQKVTIYLPPELYKILLIQGYIDNESIAKLVIIYLKKLQEKIENTTETKLKKYCARYKINPEQVKGFALTSYYNLDNLNKSSPKVHIND